MKTSARNQFSGTVAKVTTGAVNDEIELDISGGLKIIAIITHESTKSLGLAPGAKAVALIKASSIILVADDEGVRFSTRNRLTGKISKVATGAVNSEVVIALASGGSIAAIITNESATSLGLKVGDTASALFKASNVIVAVQA